MHGRREDLIGPAFVPQRGQRGSNQPPPPMAARRLRAACASGDLATVRTLLYVPGPPTAERHRLVNSANARGVSPLMFAIRHGHVEVCALLVDCGADLYQMTRMGASAIHLACNYGRTAIVELLLAAGGPDMLHLRGQRRMTPLLYVFMEGQHVETLRFLLCAYEKQGCLADVIDVQDEDKLSALHWAVNNGSLEMVTLLLQAGADPTLPNDAAATPLHLARERRAMQINVNHARIAHVLKKWLAEPQRCDLLHKTRVLNDLHHKTQLRSSAATVAAAAAAAVRQVGPTAGAAAAITAANKDESKEQEEEDGDAEVAAATARTEKTMSSSCSSSFSMSLPILLLLTSRRSPVPAYLLARASTVPTAAAAATESAQSAETPPQAQDLLPPFPTVELRRPGCLTDCCPSPSSFYSCGGGGGADCARRLGLYCRRRMLVQVRLRLSLQSRRRERERERKMERERLLAVVAFVVGAPPVSGGVTGGAGGGGGDGGLSPPVLKRELFIELMGLMRARWDPARKGR